MADVITESVQRQLLLMMHDSLAGHLSDVQTEMAAEDTTWYAAMGTTPKAAVLEPPKRYYPGFHPSILQAELTDMPLVAAFCYESVSAGDQGADHYEPITHTASIEAVVEDPDPEVVGMKAQRYAKAMHRVMLGDRLLGDIKAKPLDHSPTVSISLMTTRRVSPDREEQTHVQACRLEYAYVIERAW